MKLVFDSDVAKVCGVIPAVLFEHFVFWCNFNRENGQNEHGGIFWTYCSIREIRERFPFFSKRQIEYALNSLVKHGYLLRGNYNVKGYDRTCWYAVKTLELFISQNCEMTSQNCEMQFTNLGNPFHKMGSPIPDNNTNNNTNNYKKESKKKEPSFDSILDSYSVIKDNPELKETFVEFIKMRKAAKKPFTNKALKLNINKAVALGNGDPETIQKVVEQTIEHGWQGMFPLKDDRPKAKTEPIGNEFDRLLNGEEVESHNEFEELLRKGNGA